MPEKLQLGPCLRIVSRLANYHHSYTMNSYYVENHLKCNLSMNVWLTIIKAFRYVEFKAVTPSLAICVMMNLWDSLLKDQWDYINICDSQHANYASMLDLERSPSKSSPGFFETEQDLSISLQEESNSEGTSGVKIDRSKVIEEVDESSMSNSFSGESSDEASVESLEDVDTLRAVDNLFDSSEKKRSKFVRVNAKEDVIEAQSEEDEEPEELEVQRHQSNTDKTPMSKFSRSTNQFKFGREEEETKALPKLQSRAVVVGRSNPIKGGKKALASALEQIVGETLLETPNNWDEFNIYAEENRFAIKQVLKDYIVNFDNNILLNVLMGKDFVGTIKGFRHKLLLHNNAVLSKGHQQGCFSAPRFRLQETSKSGRLTGKIIPYIAQLVNSNAASDEQFTTKRTEAKLNKQVTVKEELAPGPQRQHEGLRLIFAQESLDEDTARFLNDNFRAFMSNLLTADVAKIVRMSFRITLVYEIPEINLIANEQIMEWMSIIIINLKLVNRKFRYLRMDSYSVLLDMLIPNLEEVITRFQKFTIFIDLRSIVKRELGQGVQERVLQDLFNEISLFSTGDILEELDQEKFKLIMATLRKQESMSQLTFDELSFQVKKTIREYINFVFIVKGSEINHWTDFMHQNYPRLFSKTLFQKYLPMSHSNSFEKSVYFQILKLKQGKSKEEPSTFNVSDSRLFADLVARSGVSTDEIVKSMAEYRIPGDKDKIEKVVELSIILKLYQQEFDRYDQDGAIGVFEDLLLLNVRDKPSSEVTVDVMAKESSNNFSDVNMCGLLRLEEPAQKLFAEGWNPSTLHINLLSIGYLCLMHDLSILGLIYDPFEMSRCFYAELASKPANKMLIYDFYDKNRMKMEDLIKLDKKAVFIIKSLNESILKILIELLKAHSIYRYGRKLSFFERKTSWPSIYLEGVRTSFNPDFRFLVVCSTKSEFMRLVNAIRSVYLDEFVRPLCFEDTILSVFNNSTRLIQSLDRASKFNKSIPAILKAGKSGLISQVFRIIEEQRQVIQIDEYLNLRLVEALKEERLAQIPLQEILMPILKMDNSDSDAVQDFALQGTWRVSVQFKRGLQQVSPFDRCFEQKYITDSYKDVVSVYVKVGCFIQSVSRLDKKFRAELLYPAFISCLERYMRTAVQASTALARQSHELLDSKGSGESRNRMVILNERICKIVEHEWPLFWSELMMSFVEIAGRMMDEEERATFRLWMWINHFSSQADTDRAKPSVPSMTRRYTTTNFGNKPKKTQSPVSMIGEEDYHEMELRDLRICFKQNYHRETSHTPTSTKSHREAAPVMKSHLYQIYHELYKQYNQQLFVNFNPFDYVPSKDTQDEDDMNPILKELSFVSSPSSDQVSSPKSAKTPKVSATVSSDKDEYSHSPSPVFKKSRFATMYRKPENSSPDPKIPSMPETNKESLSESKDEIKSQKSLENLSNVENIDRTMSPFGDFPSKREFKLNPLKIESDDNNRNNDDDDEEGLFMKLELEDQVSPMLMVTPQKGSKVNKFTSKNTDEDKKRNRVERVSFVVDPLEGVNSSMMEIREIDPDSSPRRSRLNQSMFSRQEIKKKLSIGLERSKFNSKTNDGGYSPMLKKMTTKGSKPKAPNSIPPEVTKGLIEAFGKERAKALHFILEMSIDSDNFKTYLSILKAVLDNLEGWKAFYWARRQEVYRERQVLVPGTKYIQLTYTEILNILFFFRPHEISNYLTRLPLANNYAFAVETISKWGVFALHAAASRFVLVDLSQPFVINPFVMLGIAMNERDSAFVHLFEELVMNEASRAKLERLISEGKHFIIHDLFSWRQTNRQQIIEFFEEKREEVLSTFKVFIVRRNPSLSLRKNEESSLTSVINLGASATTMKSLCIDLITLEKKVVYNTGLWVTDHPLSLYKQVNSLDQIHENSTLRKNSFTTEEKKYQKHRTLNDLYEVSNVKAVLLHNGKKLTINMNEGRVGNIIYFIFSALLLRQEASAEPGSSAIWLNMHDIVFLKSIIIKNLHALGSTSPQSFLSCLELFFGSWKPSICSPVISYHKIEALAADQLMNALSSPVINNVNIDKCSYRISSESVQQGLLESLSLFAQFPDTDPQQLLDVSERNAVIDDKRKSADIFMRLKELRDKDRLKVSFNDSLNMVDNKGRIIRLEDSEGPASGNSWVEQFNKKMNFLMIINILGGINETSVTKNSTISEVFRATRIDVEEDKDNSCQDEDSPDDDRSYLPAYAKRNPRVLGANSKKTVLSGFRDNMASKFSHKKSIVLPAHEFSRKNSMFKAPSRKGSEMNIFIADTRELGQLPRGSTFMRNGTQDMSPDALQRKGSILNRDTSTPNKLKSQGSGFFNQSQFGPSLGKTLAPNQPQMGHSSRTSRYNLMKNAPVRASTMKLRDNQINQCGLTITFLKTDEIRTSLLKKGKVYKAQELHEVYHAHKVQEIIRGLLVGKFEAFSGEIPPQLSDTRNTILEDSDSSSNALMTVPATYHQSLLKDILRNRVPATFLPLVPLDSSSVFKDSSFHVFWTSLTKKVSYAGKFSSDDSLPSTGSYDLSLMFKPLSLLVNWAMLYSLQSKVSPV
jgi:hypothetical protein